MARIDVHWSEIAPPVEPSGFLPSDPASVGYDWTRLDTRVRELTAAHMQIMITVFQAPSWAEAENQPRSAAPGSWRPSPSAFAAFAHAIATRYDGHYRPPFSTGKPLPRVRYWQAWNEPNLTIDLTPQWTNGGSTPASPGIYRRLLNAFYTAVKRASESDVVLAAGLAPYGVSPGNPSMDPVPFERDLLCLAPSLRRNVTCNAKTHLDAIDSHVYSRGGPNWRAPNPGDVAVPDVHKLVDVLHAGQRAHTVLPRSGQSVWTTEISWPTNPPDPQGVPSLVEAHWLEQALYMLWHQGVSTVLWWELADAPLTTSDARYNEGGVYLLDGRAKPSATAFRFPLVVIRHSKKALEVWGRSPSAGTLAIQQHRGHAWRTVVRARVSARQVFELPVPIGGKTTIRGRIGTSTSLTWSVR